MFNRLVSVMAEQAGESAKVMSSPEVAPSTSLGNEPATEGSPLQLVATASRSRPGLPGRRRTAEHRGEAEGEAGHRRA